MKEILLSKNKVAIVDDEDFEKLNKFRWHYLDGGYAYRIIAKMSVYMHRMIMDAPDHLMVDHINHNKLDNRKENLRLVSRSLNGLNRKETKAKSGFMGVYQVGKKWCSCIVVDGKSLYLGIFESPNEASCAYNEFKKKVFKDQNLQYHPVNYFKQ